MKTNYTEEKNVLMLISILKHNNIKKVIISPGTTNIAFVASIQSDPFFEIYSCIDERSACYMASGMATESKEPVVLTCTGATASRNYMPGLTEAYYRKIPILVVTAARHFSKIGNNIPQAIDRSQQLKDIVKLSVQIPIINSSEDELGCNILLNKAILELKHKGGGPVHIDIVMNGEGGNFSVKELPNTRYIDRFNINDNLPSINHNKIAIFIGAHKKWDDFAIEKIETFCETYNSLVICDHTSNYHGKYRIIGNLLLDQEQYDCPLNSFDLVIHLGDVSGSYMKVKTKEVWRVNPDGQIIDTFSKLSNVFEMTETDFFNHYNNIIKQDKSTSNYDLWKQEYDELKTKLTNCTLPFSNLFVAKNIIDKMPKDSYIHLAILNSLRSWNYFDTPNKYYIYSNTGGFGIDGPMSTLIGASLCNPQKNYYGIIGDLAFFYDLNSLGNINIKNNIRIILINNGCGTEFMNYSHPASKLSENAQKYIAAIGHNGNKSASLVKNFVENLGFEYIKASNEDEFIEKIDYFTSDKLYDKPLVFEIFTNSNDESEALKMIRNLKKSLKVTLKKNVQAKIKKIAGPKTKKIIKAIISK